MESKEGEFSNSNILLDSAWMRKHQGYDLGIVLIEHVFEGIRILIYYLYIIYIYDVIENDSKSTYLLQSELQSKKTLSTLEIMA